MPVIVADGIAGSFVAISGAPLAGGPDLSGLCLCAGEMTTATCSTSLLSPELLFKYLSHCRKPYLCLG